jgi:hypothetical protein
MQHALRRIAAALLVLTPALASTSETPRAQIARPQENCGLTPSRKFDAYGEVGEADEHARLDKLAAAMRVEADEVRAFIVGYGGRGARAGEGTRRADRAKYYLTEKLYWINVRLNTLDCGYRDAPATELWLTTVGAAPPPCSRTLTPAEARIKPDGGKRQPSRATSKKRPRKRR